MNKAITLLFSGAILLGSGFIKAQDNASEQGPTLITQPVYRLEVPSITEQIAAGTFKPAEDRIREFNPKKWGSNTSVPGKGLPKGNDPLWEKQTRAPQRQGKAPILSFDAASATATPTDPTGAVGPNHFMNSWNSSFRIWDKSGNPLTAAASLGTIFPGTMGDPIVLYDPFADRFLISEFYSNGFDVAVSKGPNPVTSGWWVYRFATNTFPDYPKFSVWSDGYYITANKDQGSAGTSQVVFVLDRIKMLNGDPSATMVGFPLTGIVTSGFYSPLAFNANGPTPPPAGNVPVVYMQDDSWSGVSTDHLKIWSINVNWTTPASSTISAPQVINTTPFDGLFDGGSFSNLPQPSGSDIDALQATIMFMAHYRQFASYNSAVFNFVVDLNGLDNKAGIRWYELRQTAHGQPWTIHQEGTYSQPNGHSAFCGNMAMDINGNIGMAYTVVSTTQMPALRFTGRYASDPPGTMTIAEDVIVNGTSVDPSSRYGDYSQMTIDPVDNSTFWSIGEYFASGRKNRVGVFQIAPPALTAQFSATPTSVCAGGSVVFTDNSLAAPTAWNWSFPGGTPSTYSGQTPPPIVYSTPGTYDVTLTVTKGAESDTEVKTGYITVKGVIADFSGTPLTVVVGNSATFTDNSNCSPTSWVWSFPGGTPSSYTGQTPPPVTYSTTGTYNVSLTVTNAMGTDTKTRTNYITVTPPVFNMTNGQVTTCTGDFYDPGGPTAPYGNDQDFTMTFLPGTSGSMLKFIFTAFNLESQTTCNYDYLKIYNGINTSAPLIGTYCGTTSPGTVIANNASGAITFVFHSDISVTPAGWAATISCISGGVLNPATFTAASMSTSQVDLAWTKNSSNNDVMIVWSPNTTFGVPADGTAYTPGQSVAGGGTVLYRGSLTSFSHTALSPNTYYYYKAYSYNQSNNYSSGISASASTSCNALVAFPWTESFENGGQIPACWTQEYVTTPILNWIFVKGNGSLNPSTTHSGNYNACLKDNTSGDNKTRLITPKLNLSNLPQPQLKFWHTQAYWDPDQDLLNVYYKNSEGGNWVLLTAYSSNINVWTEETLTLPSATSAYFIAFEGNAKYGYGICIDDVSISSACLNVYPVSVSVAASTSDICEGTTVTFTATPVNGGTSPVYQWKVNGSNAGSGGPNYSYAPANGDIVTCVMTSNELCVTGNSATSNALTMTVNQVLPVSLSVTASANPVEAGTPVTFTALPVNGGTIPSYQWKVNGVASGTSTSQYTFVPSDGDAVSCEMTPDVTCPSVTPVISNTVVITVNMIPASTTVQNVTVDGNNCYNALQTITVAGGGTTFLVVPSGNATFIAGENILFYPGTTVSEGGYMLGYIAPGGPWCSTLPIGAVIAGKEESVIGSDSENFVLYPNPTKGIFTIALRGELPREEIEVRIYDMRGDLVISTILDHTGEVHVSLADFPAGVYFVRLISGNVSGVGKVVKQ